MAKQNEETYEPDEPRPFTWSGIDMWRCPFDRCAWSHQDRDVVIDHINGTGHVGPDPETEEETPEEQTPEQSGARKGGK